jgi:tetratricopeptide (TPR) repeat protein
VMLTGGRLAEAQALLKQANSSYRQIGDLPGVALVLADLGEIALQRANLPEARKDYEAAVAAGLRAGDKSSTAYGVAGLGDVFLQQDQLAEARGQYGKALQLRTDIGEKQSILETTVALSRLAIEEGHAGDAEKEAAQCQSELHEEQFADDELDAGLVLVRAQLNQAKNADAQRSIDLLRPLAEKTQSRVLHLRFLLESAEMLRATHQEAASRSLLDEVAKEAEASGLATFAWEVDTLRAHAEADAGHAERAEQLSRLTEDKARHAGYRLLARHAQLSQARSNAPINPA